MSYCVCPGNELVESGHSLIVWSRLVKWDATNLRFVPTEEACFERYQKSVHPTLGRLLCWLAFSVGSEYLLKGVLKANSLLETQEPEWVFRPPEHSESLDEWAKAVVDKSPTMKYEAAKYKTLGKLAQEIACLRRIDQALRIKTQAAFMYLNSTIRNRDAHQYKAGVRAGDFWLLEPLFVPALNALISTLEQPVSQTSLTNGLDASQAN